MQDETVESADSPSQEPPADPATAADPTAPRRRKRWSWQRWVANLMIIVGVLCLPGYFLGSCGYTWLQQRDLRQQLEEADPQMAVSIEMLTDEDFFPLEMRAGNSEESSAAAAEQAAAAAEQAATAAEQAAAAAEQAAREEAIAAAKAERDAQLAAFKAAADAFAATVSGQIALPIGRIIIPSIGVDVVMVEGTGKSDLKEGPGHWEETPFPGQGGNFVVSGHRTTYGAPFFKLNEVEVGDEIDLVLPYAIARYTVTKVFIVYPDEVDTVGQHGREQVSLAACHPIYSAKQRIVVQGDLAGFKLVEATD